MPDTRKAPGLSTEVRQIRSPAPVDMSRTLSAIDQLAGKVSTLAGVQRDAYKRQKEAQANGDVLANTINEDDLVNDRTYSRTVSARQNEDLFN